jgi:hypothetical protein
MTAVSPNLIDREETWDPRVFCGRFLPVLRLSDVHAVEVQGVEVVEGQRWGEGPEADGPVYRLSNIGELEMRLEPQHAASPMFANNRCVGPGDVVVSKIAPVRAAFVTPNVFRHPVDANCFLVRGLDLAMGFWFALCINQPAFGEYLVRKSGAAIVPRVRADVLESVRLPRPPAGIEVTSRRIYACIEKRIDSQVELFRFLATVREEVVSRMPGPSFDDGDDKTAATTWHHFFQSADIDDSLVPGHVAVSGYQRRLKHNAGWKSIRHLTSSKGWGGNRITDHAGGVRTLQLSDVGDDLTVLKSQVRSDVSASRRVYAEPLHLNEVLLSALVSRSRVAFAGYQPPTEIHPTDHWHRLRFHETPGAWAAVLRDSAIHEQLGRLAIGTVQQFAPPSTIQKLVLPDVSLEVRIKWDAFLRRWQLRRLELEREWVRLMAESYALLRETHRDCGPWTEPPAALRGEESWS